jgi:FkbM family methyltransferase
MTSLRVKIVSILNRHLLVRTRFQISQKNRIEILVKEFPKEINLHSKVNLARSTLFTPQDLINTYKIPVQGILHVGAHKGEEVRIYSEMGIEFGVFIEPISENYRALCQRTKGIKGYQTIQMAAGDKDMETKIFLASNDLQSSSLLKPADHLAQNPEITFDNEEVVRMRRIDSLNLSNSLNFWVIDVQGFELAALTGAGRKLEFCDYIYIEINRANVYDGCAKVEEIDEFLSKEGFGRVVTRWWDIWGDGFYVRNNKLPLRASINVAP